MLIKTKSVDLSWDYFNKHQEYHRIIQERKKINDTFEKNTMNDIFNDKSMIDVHMKTFE